VVRITRNADPNDATITLISNVYDKMGNSGDIMEDDRNRK
jgi:hypothetical protein